MHTQKVSQRIHSTSNILVNLKLNLFEWGNAAPPIKLNFADNQCIDRCRSLFAIAREVDVDNGLDITRARYKFGYDIFGFNTSPSLCYGEPQERKRNGT